MRIDKLPGDPTVDVLIELGFPSLTPSPSLSVLPPSRGLCGLVDLASLPQPELNVCGWLTARLLACHSAG